MRFQLWRRIVLIVPALGIAAATVISHQLASIAAGGLLYPGRRTSLPARPANCEEREFAGQGITLRGWYCRTSGRVRGTLIYLHGTADNRGSSVGVIRRFTTAGFDVVAYDSRRHGASEGDVCTYGYFEKHDLHRVIDGLPEAPVVLFGTSLGAAVALQETAENARITAVVAAEVFSDLRTIARERAPFFLSNGTIQRAFGIAESRGRFIVDDVSPVESAKLITVPVLLIHGADDRDTPPTHSQRVLDALAGPRRLILVERAGHNRSLSDPAVWREIDAWLEHVLPEQKRS